MEDKWLIVENCIFNIEFNIFRSIEPVNAIFRNNTAIIDSTPGGFRFEVSCNYPGAFLLGTIIFENNNITMSTKGKGFIREIFGFYGPQNVTFKNNFI